ALVAFALARIIAKKTRRILNRETALQLGVFALVSLLLFAGLRLDLYGYERRVPDASRVSSVVLSPPIPVLDAIIRFGEGYTFREAANIEAVTAFHRRVTENRAALRAVLASPYAYGPAYVYNTTLRYAFSGAGSSLSRSYGKLPADFCKEDASLRALVESEEFRAQNSFENPAIGKIESISVSENIIGMESIVLSSDAYDGLTDAVDRDLRLLDYDRFFDLTQPLAVIDVSSRVDDDSRWFSLSVSPRFANTVAWLSENGYYDRLTAWRDSVKSIRLVHYTATRDPADRFRRIGSEEEIAVFRDPESIRAALEGAESDAWDQNDVYRLYFSLGPDTYFGGAEGVYGGPETADDKVIHGQERVLFLNPGNPALDALLAAAGRQR
ncbi:MAG: hypothetical protein LBT00_08355, partial [Spirochaetaceae bacterium]|nr:hypothetical protein [Spirochaetaceae bacterium]